VTEFIEDGSLEKLIETYNVPVEDKKVIFAQLMYAINHLH